LEIFSTVPRPKRGRYGAPAFFDSVVARRPLCSCLQCHRETIISADQWPGDLAVASVGLKMMCTKCGTIGADARPNWPAFILALCDFCHARRWYQSNVKFFFRERGWIRVRV